MTDIADKDPSRIKGERHQREVIEYCNCSAMKCGPHRWWPSSIGWLFGGSMLIVNFFLFVNISAIAERGVIDTREELVSKVNISVSKLNAAYNESTASLKGEVKDAMEAWGIWTQEAMEYWWRVMPPETPEGRARIESKIKKGIQEDMVNDLRDRFGMKHIKATRKE
ncbi:hypothetical protein LCGC14_1826330 [marine sediment metagenome]|uniref:Uncharacterized protein n=1 Tax=marine sediment metagenome TaxID=412755 RepID=A0A0F9H5M7_9ZZZZ